MNCKKCGEIVDPSMGRCPYCGKRIRRDAQPDRNTGNVQPAWNGGKPGDSQPLRYHGNMGNTQPVRYTGVVVRSVVLAVLVLVFLMLVVSVYNWHFVYKLNDIKLRLAYEKNMEQMEEYLEAEDYLMLGQCYLEWNGVYYGRAEFESCYPVLRASRMYEWLYGNVLDYAIAAEEDKDSKLELVVDTVGDIYPDFDDDSYFFYGNTDTPENRQHVENIHKMMDELLMVYCGLTEEEVAQLGGLSERELYLLFE